MGRLCSLEICAGGGGLALGLERAGFDPVMLIDNDRDACATLRANRPHWNVRQFDLLDFAAADHQQVLDVDLLAGGPPRLPYSVASNQGEPEHDRQDMVRAAVWLTVEVRPRAVLLENVPALVKDTRFAETRSFVEEELGNAGYEVRWGILDAQDFGVPQRREHGVIVAMRPKDMARFAWPEPTGGAVTVGEALWESMASRGWTDAAKWRHMANEIAPPLIGGSKKRGGADLGPTRTKQIWARLGVNGNSLANDVPGPDFVLDPDGGELPRLTAGQAAVLQAFPDEWTFAGKKTSRYRQIAQAVPPPLATALGCRIAQTLKT
ncbi:DNA cytosine methyltransferase [Actinomadura adrarensis]|uniref:DNA (cytosine-5-)-methyltransferase n=1 Tax=Actinomadura adrarensis TaxID=1819600 RepID=A0ABW3C8Q3_9ACTN